MKGEKGERLKVKGERLKVKEKKAQSSMLKAQREKRPGWLKEHFV